MPLFDANERVLLTQYEIAVLVSEEFTLPFNVAEEVDIFEAAVVRAYGLLAVIVRIEP